MKRTPFIGALGIGSLAAVAFLFFLLGRGTITFDGAFGRRASLVPSSEKPKETGTKQELTAEEQKASDEIAEAIRKKLTDLVLDSAKGPVRKNQTVLKARSDAEFHELMKKLKEDGFAILNSNARLNSILAGTPSLNKLRDFLAKNPNLDPDLLTNPLLQIPTPLESKDPGQATDRAFSADGVKAMLGAADLKSTTGTGVKVAVLDSAVANLPLFDGQLVIAKSSLENPTSNLEHGTAVASLIKTFAPGATIHSYPVVAGDGMSDAFTIADAIVQAVNNGAVVINVSLGSYQDNAALAEAVALAKANSVILVASAGNEGLNNATFPARYDGVVAALAGDANGMTASFSNNSSNYGFLLPGVGVPVTYPDGQQYAADGTSFSSPIMGALLAGLMSDYQVSAPQALQMFQATSNDAGAAGPDEAAGYGWPNLMDIRNMQTAGYTDGRLASNYFNTSNPDQASMDYVVQNNGNTTMTGWGLSVETNGNPGAVRVPDLAPGQSWAYSVPLDVNGQGPMLFNSQLNAPPGTRDASGMNNALHTSVTPVKK